MKIKKLNLENFRLLTNKVFDFSEGVNLIYGDNGVGKTTILEAIAMLSDGNSFRTRTEKDLISTNQPCALITSRIVSSNLSHTLKILLLENGRKIQLDGNKIVKLSHLLGIFNAIVFIPADIYLFSQAPKVRRKFLDLELSKIYPSYLKLSIRYHKILKEKSRYLKFDNIDKQLLEVYNNQLITASIEIVRMRREFLQALEGKVNNIFSELTKKVGRLKFAYDSLVDLDDTELTLKEKYDEQLEKEILKKTILLGPHQDDFDLIYQEEESNSINAYFSQGETRMAILSIKLALAQHIEEIMQEKCVLLLDDVLSEIDFDKKNQLMKLLKNYGQVFITTVTLEDIAEEILADLNKIEI